MDIFQYFTLLFNGEEQEKNKQESKYSITKLIEWLPAWKDFPKRNHSIFMSNSPKYASNWVQQSGSLYECIAEAKLGMCLGYDFNDLTSWPYAVSLLMPDTKVEYSPFTINTYDAFAGKTLSYLLKSQLVWWLQTTISNKWGELGAKIKKAVEDSKLKHYDLKPYLKPNLKKIDAIIKNISRTEYHNAWIEKQERSEHKSPESEIKKLMFMFDLIKKYGGLQALIEDAFDPIKNGFSIVTQKEVPNIVGDKNIRELWTDSKVFLTKIPSIKVKQTIISD